MHQDTIQLQTDFVEQVVAFRNNDEKAWKEFYVKNYAAVERYVIENSGTRDEAKDIYQEAFLVVWRNVQLQKFVPHHGKSLADYLYKVARNKWIDQLRALKRRSFLSLTENLEQQPDPVDEEKIDEGLIITVRNKFKMLGGNCQDLLERFYYKKESIRKIATDLSWTEATAKNNKYRCMQRLKELLKN